MKTSKAAATMVILAMIMASLLIILYGTPRGGNNRQGILIISTFPSLVNDIKQVTCRNETVKPLIPKGVDPHEYQLTPRDIETLRNSQLIISTGHTSFEAKIRDLVEKREVKAYLIEIPEIPGLKITRNPVTGRENYHMPITDPDNYLVFMENLTEELNIIDPQCKLQHNQNMYLLKKQITSLLRYRGEYNYTVAASDPTVIYQISWLGFQVKYLFIIEHDTPVSYKQLSMIINAIKQRKIDCIVSSTSTRVKLKDYLDQLKDEYPWITIVYIPGPLDSHSIPWKLNQTIISMDKCK